MEETSNKNNNLIIVGVLVAFLFAIVAGTAVIILYFMPATGATSTASNGGSVNSVPAGGTTPEYLVCKPSDLSFTSEIPPSFSYKMTSNRENLPNNGGVLVTKAYTAGGGTGAIDGFAVIRMVDLVDKRSDDLSRDDFLKEIIDKSFVNVNCKKDLIKDISRTAGDGYHCEGQGWQASRGKAYFMVLEGLVVDNDIIILMVAGYDKQVFTHPATAHFFESFALTTPE